MWLQSVSHRQTALLCLTPSISMHKNSQLQYRYWKQLRSEPHPPQKVAVIDFYIYKAFSIKFWRSVEEKQGVNKSDGFIIIGWRKWLSDRHVNYKESQDRGERAGYSPWLGGEKESQHLKWWMNEEKGRRERKCQLLLETWISKQVVKRIS